MQLRAPLSKQDGVITVDGAIYLFSLTLKAERDSYAEVVMFSSQERVNKRCSVSEDGNISYDADDDGSQMINRR